MKFRKLLFGLAVAPVLLASCRGTMSLEQAKKWINDNYKGGDKIPAIARISWDFHSTIGNKANDYVNSIFKELHDKAVEDEGIVEGIIPDSKYAGMLSVGEKTIVPDLEKGRPTQYMNQLKADELDDYESLTPTYKVNGGEFSITYKYPVVCITEKEVNADLIRVFNTNGYCSYFGYKANKYLDKENTIKFKFIIHFIYADDPID